MSKKKLTETQILEKVIFTAKKNGATSVDAILFKNNGLSINIRNGYDETIENYDSSDLGIRVFIGNKNVNLSTNDTSEVNIEKFTKHATELVKSVPDDKYTRIASKELLKIKPINKNLHLETFDSFKPDLDILRKKATDLEKNALNTSKVLKSDGSNASWNSSSSILMTSNGFFGKKQRSNSSLSIVLIGEKNSKMERDYDFSSKVFFDDLEDPITLGKKAGNKVVEKLGSKKAKTGHFPVVFSPRVSRSIVNHIASAINGSSIARGASFLKDSLNQHMFSKQVSITDDPHIKRGVGSKIFDAEGIGTNKKSLIRKGIIKNWLLDISTGIQLKMETNGNAIRGVSTPPTPGISNFILLPGLPTPEDLIQDIKEGFYATELIGSSVSLITGDYSRGASGFWIENGRISFPVSEVTIAGNLKEMFMKIQPANDLDYSYSTIAPTLKIENMVIAGE